MGGDDGSHVVVKGVQYYITKSEENDAWVMVYTVGGAGRRWSKHSHASPDFPILQNGTKPCSIRQAEVAGSCIDGKL